MIEQLMNEYGYRESCTDDLLIPHVLTDSNSVGYGGGVESLTEGSWPFDQPSESNGPTPMATIDLQSYYGGISDTGFELLDFISPDTEEPIHIPFYGSSMFGTYMLTYYALLHDGYNLPNFTKLLVDNADYDIYPLPEQEPSTAGCYSTGIGEYIIDSQEAADETKAITGIDVKIGDTMIQMNFFLLTEQVLSGDVPFTLYADQDSWSGTLHEYVDISAEVYGGFDPNSALTAYEISVYTEKASNPQYKINDGEWTQYNIDNKSEVYQPGNYTIYLKAERNYDGSEIFNTTQLQINADFAAPELHIVEDPSAMFAGLDFRVRLYANYYSDLIGRDDVVLLYKELSAADWSSAPMTSTSNGYFAEVETGWGHKDIEYKVQINGVSSDVVEYYEFDAVPMTPSFVDIINDQGTYKARLRFGANYPDMNTVETIEYSFDNENWVDAVHDAVSSYELAEILYGTFLDEPQNYWPLPERIYFRTKISSEPATLSDIVIKNLSKAYCSPRGDLENCQGITINSNEVIRASSPSGSAAAEVILVSAQDTNPTVHVNIELKPGFVIDAVYIYAVFNDSAIPEELVATFQGQNIFDFYAYATVNNSEVIDYKIEVELQQQSPSDDNS